MGVLCLSARISIAPYSMWSFVVPLKIFFSSSVLFFFRFVDFLGTEMHHDAYIGDFVPKHEKRTFCIIRSILLLSCNVNLTILVPILVFVLESSRIIYYLAYKGSKTSKMSA
jgi:hypothetical protein